MTTPRSVESPAEDLHEEGRGGSTKRNPPGYVLPLPGQASEPEASERKSDPQPIQARQIGRYEIAREIARGGMGVVLQAHDPKLDRGVAIKVLQGVGRADDSDLERFTLEAQATAGLRHPNIVPVHDAGLHNGTPFIVMDLIEGESLAERLRHGGVFEPKEAARLLEPVARALDYAHTCKVLHRDIKPPNILVTKDGVPLLTDFGLAKVTEVADRRLTVSGEVLGTPAYMPPEQALGDMTRVGPPADIYSLGASLYELLVGVPPYQGLGVIQILSKILEDPPPQPRSLRPDLDVDLEWIVLKAMEREPSHRYASAGDMADDLGCYLRGEPPRSRPAGHVELATGWLRRHAITLLLATVATAAVSALALAKVAQETAEQRIAELELESAETRREEVAHYLREGRARVHRSDYYGAALELDQAHHRDPANLDVLAWRGLAHARNGDYESAIKDFDQIQTSAPNHPRGLYHRVLMESFQQNGKVEQEPLEHVLSVTPADDAKGSALRGEILLALGRPADAMAALLRALELEPSADKGRMAERQLLIGLAHLKLNEWPEALRALDQALALDSAYADARVKRAYVRAQLADYVGALRDVDRSLSQVPPGSHYRNLLLRDRSIIYARLGMQEHTRQRWREAVQAFSEALEGQDPETRATIYAWRGLAYVNLAKDQEANEDFEQALRLQPKDARTLFHRAIMKYRRGDKTGGRADLRLAQEAIQPSELSLRGELLLRLPKYAEARLAFDRALAKPSSRVYRLRGVAQYRLGELENALVDYDRAIALDSLNAEAYFQRAQVLENLTRFEDALRDLDRAAELFDPRSVRIHSIEQELRPAIERALRERASEPQ